MAMLLADEGGASLIVAVGTHATLVEFLDKGRQGMASTFLTRLRIGSKLVDAKGVSRLYRSRISLWSLLAPGAGDAARDDRRALRLAGRRRLQRAAHRRRGPRVVLGGVAAVNLPGGWELLLVLLLQVLVVVGVVVLLVRVLRRR
jgi:hypothetical protein